MDMSAPSPSSAPASAWLDRPLWPGAPWRRETALFALLLALAVVTRFVHLGQRVMSHDESLHTYYSWLFYRGQGYQHTPMMHGPLQFHLIALSFFLFGDSDFTARLPHALAGVLTLAFMWAWRRYLGRWGALIATGLLLISPYMLYYARYARNESLVALFGVVFLWALLRYLETGATRYLYVLTVALALHYTAKETAFIYTAQALLFLGGRLLQKVWRDRAWKIPLRRRTFAFALLAALVLTALTLLTEIGWARLQAQGVTITTEAGEAAGGALGLSPYGRLFLLLAGLTFLAATAFLFTGYDWRRLRTWRETHLIVLQISLIAPTLAPLPVKMLGFDPLSTTWPQVAVSVAAVLVLALLGAGLAFWLWEGRRWWPQMLLFWAIFITLYTSLFTNTIDGLSSGVMGSLGYWLEQQGVQRGNQPWYYYLVIHIPIYEYLPALGFLAAALAYLVDGLRSRGQTTAPSFGAPSTDRAPVTALLLFWGLTSVVAYTLAGEKMPWLTVHITWPMILLTGWWLNRQVERLLRTPRPAWPLGLLLLALVGFALGLGRGLALWLGPQPPFQGKELDALRATGSFLVYALLALGSGYAVLRLAPRVGERVVGPALTVTGFGLLAVFTWHTAYQAAYINYDQANEFLVYAHAAHGVRVVTDQLALIAERAFDGRDNLPVAYDDAVSWPLSWYLRDYSKARFYGANPDYNLRDMAVILVGAKNYAALEPIVARNFVRFEYLRMVWPTEDYRGLTWERIVNALRDPAMRAALFQIWLHRDFTLYNQVTGKDLRPSTWSPSDAMRMYVRADVAAKMWEYGSAPAPSLLETDPFEGRRVVVAAQGVLGPDLGDAGSLLAPRDVAVAPDGTLWIVDTYNHRIVHWDPVEHRALAVLGERQDADPLAPGVFNEPWGVAVAPDGSVWVADTWNQRLQHLSPEGEVLQVVDHIPAAAVPNFYGPRDVAVDAAGRVYVADTGNKRIVVFDAQGRYLTYLGGPGLGPGQFEEPVGLAIGPDGALYVADTWNQRIQVLQMVDEHTLAYVREWSVPGWYGQGVENKPYLAVDAQGRVYATDPEVGRVLVFDASGNPLWAWDSGPGGPLGTINGLAVAPDGTVWVVEASANRLIAFAPPGAAPAPASEGQGSE